MENNSKDQSISLSRRRFMTAAVATTATATVLPGCKFVAGSGSNTIPEPPNFPAGIELYQQEFINWARETKIAGVWFTAPQTAEDVVTLANWAKDNDYKLRPFGTGHGFAPTLLPRGDDGENVVLINTQEYLNGISVDDTGVTSATCGAGALIEDICAELENFDLGLYHTTAPGGISIAGALAMNAHGAAVPKTGETLQPGHSWGTLSNLILEITAVVWDATTTQYTLKTFQRDDPAIAPLLTCLARAFVVEVKIQAGPNLKIRNVSRADLLVSELLAYPEDANENSFISLSDEFGTVDVLFYPFNPAKTAWVKTWTVTPEKPENSREVTGPYNFSTGDIPPWTADVLSSGLRTFPALVVPAYNKQSGTAIADLLTNEDPDTKINDLWGSAYCSTLYVTPLTPRKTVAAWGVIVSRENVQRALAEFYSYFEELIAEFKAKRKYPYTGPVELRAHGLDRPEDVLIPNAVEPTFSGARPHPDHPEKDTVIWYAINNNVDQPEAAEFNARLEQFFLTNYQDYGIVRPEWTKGYAYSADGQFGGAWTNDEILLEQFPATWRDGYSVDNNWDTGVAQLNAMDPHRIFTNDHLDRLFPA
ncbi:MAG: FAD-binding protein [Pseudomonadales bacterium]|nr:FAD-binding protein [Pseudomonadales bacterium]